MIRLLDTHTINKIAAGEVVERPASVVKELVENSIDAKASQITVEIKNGGIDLIRITDNGKGIPKDEVEMAFLRHATSKITSAEDLLEVLSLGFRGEALASVAAVAQVELITKTPGEMTGKRVEVSGGKIKASEEIACPEGTTIIMRQLFYNVPARKAFLKSSGTEAAKIADYMYKLALAHPEIAFKYIQNNKLIFGTSGNQDLKQCVFHLYGKETAKNVLPVNYEVNDVHMVGLMGNPSLTRANRQYEHFFINGRYIKSAILQKAVEDAYKTLITIGKFPFVILHLNMNPDQVDVNVHPTKLEVRFRDTEGIYNVVYEGMLHALKGESLIPDMESLKISKTLKPSEPESTAEQVRVESFFAKHAAPEDYKPSKLVSIPKATPYTTKPTFSASQNAHTQTTSDLSIPPPSELFRDQGSCSQESVSQHVMHKLGFQTEDTISLHESDREHGAIAQANYVSMLRQETPMIAEAPSLLNPQTGELPLDTPLSNTALPSDGLLQDLGAPMDSDESPKGMKPYGQMLQEEQHQSSDKELMVYRLKEGIDYTIVGQLFQTYWIIEYEQKILLIDQHAAHERVMYEQYMKDFTSSKVYTQMLLMPETIRLSPMELEWMSEHLEFFKQLGFHMELFGDEHLMIREVPYLFNRPMSIDTVRDLLDTIDIQKVKNLYELQEEHIIQLSCKSAIKANDVLSRDECKALIESLLNLENPYTCPHGRPTIVTLKKTDIEKIFKRIQ